MAHGQPDFGAYAAKETVGSMADNAELAARLGSIDSFDRLGDVIFLENFESGIQKWAIGLSGAAAAVEWSTKYAQHGGFSCNLHTGNTLSKYSLIRGSFYYPVQSKVGVEVWLSDEGFQGHHEIEMKFYRDLVYHIAAFRYDFFLSDLSYKDSTGAWVLLDGLFALGTGLNSFCPFKLVIDLDTSEYVKLKAGDVTHDLSGIEMQQGATGAARYFTVEVKAVTDVGIDHDTYVDSVIVTQNEP